MTSPQPDQHRERTVALPDQPRQRSLALVAIVGRPNVGKSTLFNRLVGRREAIVHDQPGVTRDRHYASAWSLGRHYTVVDTGGFDPESDDPMRQGIVRQVQIAISEADLVVCVLDAHHGATEGDRQAVGLLRKSGRPVIYVANKADSSQHENEASELYKLGVQEVIAVSALHGRNFGALEDAIVKGLGPEAVIEPRPAENIDIDAPVQPDDDRIVRVAIVGRPNAGKSSLVNRLSGTERSLVNDQPGTTRDPVDTVIERGGKKFLLVDTAGIRRKSKVMHAHDAVETVSVLRAMRSIESCEVTVLLADAIEGVGEQDAKILGIAAEHGRAIVVALNKIDQVPAAQLAKVRLAAKEKLAFCPWAPFVSISALEGKGLTKLMQTVAEVRKNFGSRVTTGELNRFFEQVLATHPPPTQRGRAPRLYYITQVQICPPTFVVMANAPESVHFSYQRYVTNQIRKRFGFEGSPVRVIYRARRRRGQAAEKR